MRIPDLIRPIEAADCAAAVALVRTVWDEHFAQHPDPSISGYWTGSRLDDIANATVAYAGPGRLCLVALDGDTVIGAAAIAPLSSRVAELRRMFVARQYRRRGIARALVWRLLEFARLSGYGRVCLGSNHALDASHSMYRSLGFREIRAYEPGGERHAIYMEIDFGATPFSPGP